MNVLLPIGIFAALAFLMGKGIQSGSGMVLPDEKTTRIVFWGLLGVSVADFIVTYIIRTKMVDRFVQSQSGTVIEKFEKAAVNLSIVVYALNLSYTIYGFVLVLLGVEMEVMMLFMAFSLLTYQLFRPRQKYLERILLKVESDENLIE
jgi:hypothetical protein